jgi:tRNA(Ile)-lysidine synthase
VRDFLERIERHILARQLASRGDSLLVAVSGGVDSMLLLHALHRLAPKHAWRLVVAHFNHQLRGAASDADATLVAHTAADLDLAFIAESWKRVAQPPRRGLSLEMGARNARHEFLARAAHQSRCGTIALAHHADDQVELFFLRLFRGAGGEGLGGMPLSNPSPVDREVKLIRPLLDFTKAELLEIAAANRIEFREDASNLDRAHDRNRIRHDLLPLIEREFGAHVSANILRSMEIVGADADHACDSAERWLESVRRTSFARLRPAVQRHVVRLQLRALGIEPEFDLIESLRISARKKITVKPRVVVWREDDGRVLSGESSALGFDASELRADLSPGQGSLRFDRLALEWKAHATRGASRPRAAQRREFFDADEIGAQIILRHWRAGDRFQPIGFPKPAKLQDLFAAAKVPRAERHQRVIAATASGKIFWVEGLRIGERFKLTEATRRRLEWRWARDAKLKAQSSKLKGSSENPVGMSRPGAPVSDPARIA